MPTLSNKIDFAIILRVRNANPNGDPLNGNRPRTDYSGLGEITDVCLKRKIRDRLMERYQALPEAEKVGQAVVVQADDRKLDEAKSLRERTDPVLAKEKDRTKVVKLACATWFDVRAFGHLQAGQLLDREGVSPVVRHRTKIIQPVGVRHRGEI